MKKSMLAFIILLISCVFISCNNETSVKLESLPPELEGLKIYEVHTGGISYVRVALLKGEINSVTYPVGKTNATTIIINKKTTRCIKLAKYFLKTTALLLLENKSI